MDPQNFIVYIDFDSTLFDTPRFRKVFMTYLADTAGIDRETVDSDGQAHFFHPTLGGYELDKHIAAYDVDPEVIWNGLAEIVKDAGYLYPESVPFVQSLLRDGYRPKILTFGESRFQHTKIAPTVAKLTDDGALGDVEVIVVDTQKNQHISALHSGQRGVLIDDKPNQDLPQGFVEIHIDRAAGITDPLITGDVVKVSTLAQARKIINRLQTTPYTI